MAPCVLNSGADSVTTSSTAVSPRDEAPSLTATKRQDNRPPQEERTSPDKWGFASTMESTIAPAKKPSVTAGYRDAKAQRPWYGRVLMGNAASRRERYRTGATSRPATVAASTRCKPGRLDRRRRNWTPAARSSRAAGIMVSGL